MGFPIFTAIGTGVGAFFGGPAGAAAGGAIGGAIDGSRGAEEQNRQAQRNAEQQMDYTTMMSNTAHQRERADLLAAGLNPILSVNAGASTPTGTSAAVVNPMEQYAASARDAAQMYMQMQKQKSEIGVLESQKAKNVVEAKVMSRGIPAAEMTNEIYENTVRPMIMKLNEARKSSAYPDYSAAKERQMQDAEWRLKHPQFKFPQKDLKQRTNP